MSKASSSARDNLIRVLLVDDEESWRELAGINLRAHSIDVTEVAESSESLRLLREKIFDCVVSDYKMPNMNGIQLCAEIKKTSKIPFILYTGQGSEEVASKAFAAGADDYVRKEETLAHYQILARSIRHAVEKKRTEEALIESEERYRQLFESMSECFQLLDLIRDESGVAVDYTYVDVNPAFERLTHKSREELVGKRARDIFGVVEQYWIDAYDRAVKTSKHVSFENYGAELDKWYEIDAWRTPQGYCAVTFTDITERKKVEEERRRFAEEIQKEKDRLSALVNSIQDEVWFADTERRFTLVNPSALKEFSYTSADSGIDIEKMALSLEVYRPDGSPRPVEESPPLRALNGEVIKRQEEMIKTPAAGELRYRSVSSAPVRDAESKIIGSVSVVRDINDLKKAEEASRESEKKYKDLIETINDFVWEIDPQARYTYCSPQMEKLWERKPEETIGKTPFDLMPQDEKMIAMKVFGEFINPPRSFSGLVTTAYDGSGRLIKMETSGVPFFGADGGFLGFRGVSRDITERMMAEEKLVKSNEKLAAAEEKLKGYAERLERMVYTRTEQLSESIFYARSLIEASLDPFVTISRGGEITDVNEATVQVTGVARRDLIGSDFSDYFTDPERARVGYLRVFKEGQVRDYPLTIRHKSGRLTDVIYNATVYRNQSGDVAGIFAAARTQNQR